jgi:hypothetical protein
MKDIVQRKYHQFIRGFQGKIAKPELKFLSDFIFGFLRQKEVNHSGISRQLSEPIQPKKTEERLGYHLNKSGLFDRITEAYWERNNRKIRKSIYLIYDESDIQKRYAEQMEGLQYVRDGSESSREKLKTGLGYHWMNIIGVEMEGYGYRWKVEEFYRQVKQDYSLEKIRYQRYNRIHNFSALLLIAMGFLSKFQNEWLDYLLAYTRNIIPKHKPISYYLYRIAESIRMILMKVERVWKPPMSSKPPVFQLELPLG